MKHILAVLLFSRSSSYGQYASKAVAVSWLHEIRISTRVGIILWDISIVIAFITL
jgi:hypothetical protein